MDSLDTGLTIGAAATVVKTVIGLVKMGIDPPRWLAPFLALVLGPVAVLLVMLASGTTLTLANVAGGIISGLAAGATAVGMSAIQDGEKQDYSGGIRP